VSDSIDAAAARDSFREVVEDIVRPPLTEVLAAISGDHERLAGAISRIGRDLKDGRDETDAALRRLDLGQRRLNADMATVTERTIYAQELARQSEDLTAQVQAALAQHATTLARHRRERLLTLLLGLLLGLLASAAAWATLR
jgi:hypothetical protein